MRFNYQELLQGRDEHGHFLVYLTPALRTAPPHTICLSLPLRTSGTHYTSLQPPSVKDMMPITCREAYGPLLHLYSPSRNTGEMDDVMYAKHSVHIQPVTKEQSLPPDLEDSSYIKLFVEAYILLFMSSLYTSSIYGVNIFLEFSLEYSTPTDASLVSYFQF